MSLKLSKRGFSLIEVLIASMILGVMIAGTMGAFTYSAQNLMTADNIAYNVARAHMESMYKGVKAGQGNDSWNHAQNVLNPTVGFVPLRNMEGMDRKYSVYKKVSQVEGARYRKVELKVRW